MNHPLNLNSARIHQICSPTQAQNHRFMDPYLLSSQTQHHQLSSVNLPYKTSQDPILVDLAKTFSVQLY